MKQKGLKPQHGFFSLTFGHAVKIVLLLLVFPTFMQAVICSFLSGFLGYQGVLL